MNHSNHSTYQQRTKHQQQLPNQPIQQNYKQGQQQRGGGVSSMNTILSQPTYDSAPPQKEINRINKELSNLEQQTSIDKNFTGFFGPN